MKERLVKEFDSVFGEGVEDVHLFFSPGRACILGEHLDYNGGLVLPYALTLGTYLALRKRNDHQCRFVSLNFETSFEISVEEINSKVENSWWNYPLGVINEFRKITSIENGFDFLFLGNLPINAGLSSSASIEVVTAFALNELFELNIELKEIALLCKRAENNFVGLQCGIMDQYVAVLGKQNHALLLDCTKLEHEYIPVNFSSHCFVISNTNKSRRLEDSQFNRRFNECTHALKILQRLLLINAIAEASPKALADIEHLFPDEIPLKRTLHLVHENDRVKKSIAALSKGDVSSLATLINESHSSSRDNFENSCDEIEAMVNACNQSPGCIASRLSGGGFGGCVISLVEKEMIEEFSASVSEAYSKITGITPDFYEAEIGDGVRQL